MQHEMRKKWWQNPLRKSSPGPKPVAPHLSMYRDLFRPALYGWEGKLSSDEELDMWVDYETDRVEIKYYNTSTNTFVKTLAFTHKEAANSSTGQLCDLFRQRVNYLIVSGRLAAGVPTTITAPVPEPELPPEPPRNVFTWN